MFSVILILFFLIQLLTSLSQSTSTRKLFWVLVLEKLAQLDSSLLLDNIASFLTPPFSSPALSASLPPSSFSCAGQGMATLGGNGGQGMAGPPWMGQLQSMHALQLQSMHPLHAMHSQMLSCMRLDRVVT